MSAVKKPDSDHELVVFDQLRAEVTKFLGQAMAGKVTDAASCEKALVTRKQIKEYKRQLKKRVDEIVDPLKARINFIKGLANQIETPLDQGEDHLKVETDRFAAQLERAREEARRIERERQEKAEREAAEARRREEAAVEAKRKAELEALERAKPKEPEPEHVGVFGTEVTEEEELTAARQSLDEKFEKERLEREARFEREKIQRETVASQNEYDARKLNVSHARKEYEVEVLDIDKVPVELLKRELRVKEAKAAYKSGGFKPIPGLKFTERVTVALGSMTHVPKGLLDDQRFTGGDRND